MTGFLARNEQRPSRHPLNFGDGDSSVIVGSNGASSFESPPLLRAREAKTVGKQGPYRRQSSGWIASLVTHLVLLVSLSLFVVKVPSVDRMLIQIPLPISESLLDEELETFQILERPELDVESMVEVAETTDVTAAIDVDPLVSIMAPREMPTMVDPIESLAMILSAPSPPARLLPVKFAVQREAGPDVGREPGQTTPGGKPDIGIEGDLGMRAARRMEFSTPEMDYTINKGLIWLARHQQPDGGWSFEHRGGECRGRCPNPGSKTEARVAATGLAPPPFLGAGNSPDHGEYRRTVAAGINFLISNTGRNGSLWRREGRMYGQGIATLALCECYGIMTLSPPKGDRHIAPAEMGTPIEPTSVNQAHDINSVVNTVDIKQLELAAKAAVGFIVKAQAADGGWRDEPGQLGDTSVVGWQVMARSRVRATQVWAATSKPMQRPADSSTRCKLRSCMIAGTDHLVRNTPTCRI